MTARRSFSREPSLLSADSLSRRSSMASNPDVFSDDYALEPIDSNLNLSLVDSIQPDHPLTTHNNNFAPYPALPNRLSLLNRPSSTNKRAVPQDGGSSIRDGATERTLSTSSRITIPRSEGPYTGPTAPSHPYAMYPQVTRASSIASMSTIRPPERPFVSTGGPEHPYSMYPQNTVSEDDEDIGTQPIPLGFTGPGFASSSRGGTNSDVGDIVGTDGHIEQLPPYTRFADNVVAKGDMRDIHGPQMAEVDTSTSERTQLMVTPTTSSREQMQLLEPGEVSHEEARKEGWREKAHRRVCGGIALWLLVLIVALIGLAGVLGGVIGGVVGRQQGSTAAKDAATTTIYMDADPANTDSSTPSCPTGKYSIPFNQTQEIQACVGNDINKQAWGCLDIAYLGMTIGRTTNGTPTVQFDDYSVNPQQFLYGPQPPDFNGSVIQLSPYRDRDNKQLGIAMFFYEQFDKLIILPSDAIVPNSKRSISEKELFHRTSPTNYPLEVDDKPWYCFWNSTINEFWIFLDEPANASSTITASSASSSTMLSTSGSTTTQPTDATGAYGVWQSQMTSYFASAASAAQSAAGSAVQSGAWPTPITHAKRSYTSAYYPTYPKLIKMVEKRKPDGNIQPYCQRMQVLADWAIVPTEDNEVVFITELEYESTPISAGQRKRDTTSQLESNCVCEWMST